MIERILGSLYARARKAYYKRRYNILRKTYSIHPTFDFAGTDIRFYGEGQIILGSDSYIGTNSTIQASKDHSVTIGSKCQISHNVRIYTSSADPDQDFTKPKIKPPKYGDVIIGDGVWIGANVFINPGIKIGDNSVIGANSVVTKDIDANCITGGVPCKLIRRKS